MSTINHADRRAALREGYRSLNAAIPAQMKGFGELHRSAVADGALPAATKEMMAVAIAIASRCGGCITLHVHDAIRAGATREQLHEAIGVALLMGGGPASIYAIEAFDAVDQFSA